MFISSHFCDFFLKRCVRIRQKSLTLKQTEHSPWETSALSHFKTLTSHNELCVQWDPLRAIYNKMLILAQNTGSPLQVQLTGFIPQWFSDFEDVTMVKESSMVHDLTSVNMIIKTRCYAGLQEIFLSHVLYRVHQTWSAPHDSMNFLVMTEIPFFSKSDWISDSFYLQHRFAPLLFICSAFKSATLSVTKDTPISLSAIQHWNL